MQAVADNFPIIFTAMLLSLALCWWGLSNYVIASRNQDQDAADTDNTTSGTSQFASREAVNRQTRSRYRTNKNGSRISAELKSVAALQTRVRQRQQIATPATVSTGNSASTSINNARLNLGPVPETQSESSGLPHDHSKPQRRRPLADQQMKSSARLATEQTNKSNSVAGTTGSVKPSDNQTTSVTHPGGTDAVGEKHKKSGEEKSAGVHTQVASAARAAVQNQPPVALTSEPSVNAADTNKTSRTSKPAKEASSKEIVKPSVSAQAGKPGTEKIHHAASDTTAKIAAANAKRNANTNETVEKSKAKRGTESAESSAPRLAAYKMPKPLQDKAKPPEPLTEVKTRANPAAATDANQASPSNQSSLHAPKVTDKKQNTGKQTTVARDEKPAGALNENTASSPDSKTVETGIDSSSKSAVRRLLEGKSGKKDDGNLTTDRFPQLSENKADKESSPASAPEVSDTVTLTSQNPPPLGNSRRDVGHGSKHGSNQVPAKPSIASESAENQKPATDKNASASDSDRLSVDTNVRGDAAERPQTAEITEKKVAAITASEITAQKLTSGLTTARSTQTSTEPHGTERKRQTSPDINAPPSLPIGPLADKSIRPNSRDTRGNKTGGDREKYQTAAKIKQTSPSHEAQLQLKASELPAPGNKAGTETNGTASANAKQQNSSLTTIAKTQTNGAQAAHQPAAEYAANSSSTKSDSTTAFSGADELESALVSEAKDQLIEELKARVTELEALDKQKNNTVAEQRDISNDKRRLAETTEELKLSKQKVGKLQSTLQTLQARTSHNQIASSLSAKTQKHNRIPLSSKVRVLDIKSVS